MKTKSIYNGLMFGASLMLLSSCITDDINEDPNNPLAVPIERILPLVQSNISYTLGGNVSRFSGLFSQHYGGTDRQFVPIGNYSFTESDVGSTWQYLYDALNDLRIIDSDGEIVPGDVSDSARPHYDGIADVLRAVVLGNLTDLFGDAPYTQAGNATKFPKPAYDSRDDIYAGVHALLDAAILKFAIEQADDIPAPGTDDLLYRGDVKKWTKAAHTLKARYYLHRGKRTEAMASLANGFTASSDDMVFMFGTSSSEEGPLSQFLAQRAGYLSMGEYFVDLLDGDPRLAQFVAGDDPEGAPAGVEGPKAQPGPYYGRKDAPVPIISYVEALFMKSEIMQRGGDESGARAMLRAAVAASVKQVTGADAKSAFLNGAVNGTDLKSLIMTQKYIALFSQAETWHDLRRVPGIYGSLDMPVLSRLRDKPMRFPYPLSERDFNKDNLKPLEDAGHPRDVDEQLLTPVSWE